MQRLPLKRTWFRNSLFSEIFKLTIMSHPEVSSGISRRKFLQNTTLAAGSFLIVPRHVLGRGFVAPSDKLNIAGVGVGGRAEANLPKAYNNGSDNIVALCHVDD